MAMTDEQIERYSRHIILKEVGAKGQKKLLKGKVLIIGAGGLGAPAAMYLAAAGVGTTQGTNILLNIFYGVTVNAAVGVSNQVNAAVNQFVTNFQTAFMPQIIKLYAVGDISQLQRLINRSSRFSFL